MSGRRHMRTNSKTNGLTWLKQNVSAGWQRSVRPKNKDETHPPPRRAVYRPDMRASVAQCEVIAVDGDIAWAVWITGPGTPLGDPRFDHRSLQRTVCSQSIWSKLTNHSCVLARRVRAGVEREVGAGPAHTTSLLASKRSMKESRSTRECRVIACRPM